MNPPRQKQNGSSLLYVILLSPILLLSLALAVEVGALQMQKQRLRSAVDEAAIIATSTAARAGSGASLDATIATQALRISLVDNLNPLNDILAGTTPQQIASSAEVLVINDVPSPDPLNSGQVIHAPTVETHIQVPVKSGLLSVTGIPSVITLNLTASSSLSSGGHS